MNAFRALPLLTVAFLGASCVLSRPSGRLLVLTDPATRSRMDREGLGDGALRELAGRRGLSAQVVSAPNPREADPLLRGIARQVHPKQVLLLTPFPVDADGLTAEFPQTLFIFLAHGGEEGDRLPSNWIRVLFDRTEAFRRAGEAAGRLLAGEVGGKAAVVLRDPTPDALREVDAFREGCGKAAESSRLVIRELAPASGGGAEGQPDDPQGIRTLLEGLHREGVRVFLLKAYAANAAGLEEVARLGVSAVVEDWQASRSRPEAVLLSIESDLREGIDRALAAALEADSARPESPPVQGAVRIVRGLALPEVELPGLDGRDR